MPARRMTTRPIHSEFLSGAFLLIQLLLENSEADEDAKEDAMFQAINSPKGKTIEALFSHTLRVCRISDKERGDHWGLSYQASL